MLREGKVRKKKKRQVSPLLNHCLTAVEVLYLHLSSYYKCVIWHLSAPKSL